MKHTIFLASFLLATSLGCSGLAAMGGGGLGSEACVTYFDVVETCSAKAEAKGTPAGKAKAKAWRDSAKISREAFEKNANPMAVEKSCEMMTPPIQDDPDCK